MTDLVRSSDLFCQPGSGDLGLCVVLGGLTTMTPFTEVQYVKSCYALHDVVGRVELREWTALPLSVAPGLDSGQLVCDLNERRGSISRFNLGGWDGMGPSFGP